MTLRGFLPHSLLTFILLFPFRAKFADNTWTLTNANKPTDTFKVLLSDNVVPEFPTATPPMPKTLPFTSIPLNTDMVNSQIKKEVG